MNTPVSLPSKKTRLSFKGKLIVPKDCKIISLRSGNKNGSERLTFVVDNKKLIFKQEDNHRYVEFKKGKKTVKLYIGHSIAANDWTWGPLEWKLDGQEWVAIPVENLSY